RRDRDRSRRRDAPLLLEHLGKLGRLDHGKRRQIVYELCQFSHMVTPACVFEGHSSRVCSALIARLSGAVAGTGLFGGGLFGGGLFGGGLFGGGLFGAGLLGAALLGAGLLGTGLLGMRRQDARQLTGRGLQQRR